MGMERLIWSPASWPWRQYRRVSLFRDRMKGQNLISYLSGIHFEEVEDTHPTQWRHVQYWRGITQFENWLKLFTRSFIQDRKNTRAFVNKKARKVCRNQIKYEVLSFTIVMSRSDGGYLIPGASYVALCEALQIWITWKSSHKNQRRGENLHRKRDAQMMQVKRLLLENLARPFTEREAIGRHFR